MASVKEVKLNNPLTPLGDHHTKLFNMFREKDIAAYSLVRTRGSRGEIDIERIHQLSKKVVVKEGEGEDLVVTTTDEMYMMVEWWEKDPSREDGKENNVTVIGS